MARKVLLDKFKIDEYIADIDSNLSDALLAIHKSYLSIIEPILNEDWFLGLSHITGGGLEANTQRILNSNQKLNINWNAWNWPQIFNLIQLHGEVPTDDMRRSFNLGIGMTLIIKKDLIDQAENYFKKTNEPYFIIGEIC